MTDAGPANLPGQAIGPNDLLAISVYDAPELTRTVRVGAEGYIRLPMVSQRIQARGLLPSQWETAIADILAKEGILVKPVVMVTVAEYSSRPVSVVGAVKKPGAFPVREEGQMTVLKALALAEGLSPFPQKYAYVYRHADNMGGLNEIQVELANIMRRKAMDFPLEPEDTLCVPEDEGRRRLVTTTEKIVGTGLATASGVLIWRR